MEESIKRVTCSSGWPSFFVPTKQTLLDTLWVKNMAKNFKKTDGTVTVKGKDGKILTNLPSENVIAKSKSCQDALKQELINEKAELEKESNIANETLSLSLDALVMIASRIEELEDKRLSLRIEADERNRPLDEEEIGKVKTINEKINALRSHRKSLINSNKDLRVEKAEADVSLHEQQLALDAANNIQHVKDFTETHLGEAEAVGYHETNTQEWHDQRRRFIGGSDVSAIMGTSKFTSYNKLLATKLGLIAPSTSKPLAASLGDTYEPIMQYRFAKKHAEGTDEPYTVYHTKSSWVNKTIPNHGANMDGLYDSTGTGSTPDGILEIKAVSYLEPWKDGPPIYYRQQVLWYMHVTGLRKGKIVALFNQEEYNEYDVAPNDGEIEELVSKVSEFEKRLKTEKAKLERRETTKAQTL